MNEELSSGYHLLNSKKSTSSVFTGGSLAALWLPSKFQAVKVPHQAVAPSSPYFGHLAFAPSVHFRTRITSRNLDYEIDCLSTSGEIEYIDEAATLHERLLHWGIRWFINLPSNLDWQAYIIQLPREDTTYLGHVLEYDAPEVDDVLTPGERHQFNATRQLLDTEGI